MPISKHTIDQFEDLVENGEFTLPDDDKTSYPRLIRITRPYKGSNKSLAIPHKPSRVAQTVLMKIISSIATFLGITYDDANLKCYLDGVHLNAIMLSEESTLFQSITEAYFIELKASSKADVMKEALAAREVLDDREFAIYCKPRGLDPQQFNDPAPKPVNTKTKIKLWAYDLYKSSSKLSIADAIKDAIDNAAIDPSQEGTLRKLMSKYNVSGGIRGQWDFRRLSPDVIKECETRELIDSE